MRNSLGITSITKQIFWSLFYSAWKKSFTVKNILSAFETTGIFPINFSKVLNTLNPPQTPHRPAPTQAKTPVTFISFRYAIRMQKKDPSAERLEKIEAGFAKVIAERNLEKVAVGQLKTALRVEKKKKQRGKRLNLLGEEDVGLQVFTPTAIQVAQARKAAKEEEEEQKKEEKEKKKEEAVQQRLKKQSEKEERQTARETARQQAQEEKAEKQAEKMANKEAKKRAEEEKKVQQAARSAKNPSQTTKEMPAADNGEDEGWEDDEVPRTTSHGRVLRKPSRFVQ